MTNETIEVALDKLRRLVDESIDQRQMTPGEAIDFLDSAIASLEGSLEALREENGW